MATYKRSDIVGKTLIAKQDVTAHRYNPISTDTFIIRHGMPVGRVINSVIKNNDLYWKIQESIGKDFYVKADSNKLSIDLVEAATIKSQEELAAEKKKGVIPVFLDKYGRPLVILGSVLTAIKIIVDAKKN